MRVTVAVVVSLILTSCANLSLNDVYRSPTFQYQDTRIQSLDWTSLNGMTTIELTNSNPYALPVTEISVEIWLEGSPWLTLDNTSVDSLPASSSVDVNLNWGFVYKEILQQAKGSYDKGEADFTLHVRPTLNVPVLGPQTLNWQADFTLPVPKLPKISLSSWSLEDVSFTSLVLNLGFNVENPNKFSVDGKDLGITVLNEGRALTRIGVPDMSLNSNASSKVNTQVSMSLSDVGLAVFDGFRKQRWPDAFDVEWGGKLSSKDLGMDLPSLNKINVGGLN